MKNPLLHTLIADLLRSLEQEGIALGTGRHLKVQELWRRLPEDIEPERLKTLLVPLFATNPQEQERFYAVFDKSWRRVQDLNRVEEAKPKEPIKEEVAEKNWRWLLYMAAVLFLAALAWILFRTNTAFKPVNNFHEIPLNIYRGDTLVQDPILRREETDTLRQLAFLDGEQYAIDSIWGEYEIDSFNQIIIRAGDTVGQHIDTLVVRALYNTGLDSMHFVLNLLEKRSTPLPEKEVLPEKKAPRLKTKEIPYKHDLPIPNQAALEKEAFWKKNRWWIKTSLILLLALLIVTLAEWLERRRKKAVAHLQRAHNGPPYAWTVDLDEPEELAVGLQAKQLTNRLRRRQLEDYHRIDIPATVKATARSAGQVHLQYRQPSKPSEYLLLIDRNAMQDHRALLYDNLYESFKQEEVHIDRFFYDGSPQVVFNEKYPGGLPLKELQHRFSEARLLIVGDGQRFFNPIDGEWAGWTEELNNWKARGLLTTKPLDKWSYDEDLLAQRFFLLPATLQGVDRLIEQFELVDPKPWEEVVKQIDDSTKESIVFKDDLLTTLQQHFSNHMLQWIAACAVYPQLQWKMTLHLGKELSTGQDNLLTVENILNLVRLPWFVEGKIPDPARVVLIEYLKREGLETKVRETIKILLDKAPRPSEDSVAYEKWRVNQLFNEIQVSAPSPKRRQLKRELENYLEAGFQPDQITIQSLERENVPGMAAELPDRWKELLFREGEGIFGFKTRLWAVPSWLILSGLILWFNPNYRACKGYLVIFEDQQLCLETEADQIIYNDYLSRKTIRDASRLGGYANAKVVVFPFEYIGSDGNAQNTEDLPQSEQAAIDMTDTLYQYFITGLRESIGLDIESIPPNLPYDDRQDNVNTVRRLGADFILSGTARQINGEFQLNVHITDGLSGRQHTSRMISGVGGTFRSFIDDSISTKMYSFPSIDVNSLIYGTSFTPEFFKIYENLYVDRGLDAFFPFEANSMVLLDSFSIYAAYLPSRLDDPKELKDVMINPLQDSLEAYNQRENDDRGRLLGDQYIENLATALYNKGVALFNTYLDLKEGILSDTLDLAPRYLDESAFSLLLAKDLRTSMPEVFTALLRVYGENETLIFPKTLTGQVTAAGRALTDVQVSFEGGYDALTDANGQYTINLPEDWDNNILQLNFFKPGYRVQKITHILIDENSDQVRTVELAPIPQDQEDQLVIFSGPNSPLKGVRTRTGDIIIPANYSNIEKDSETGYYRVETPATRIGSSFGYYDQRGQIVVPAIYSYLDFYSEGLAVAWEKDGKFGYLNVQGSKAFPFNFERAEAFSDGEAEVSVQNPFSGEAVRFTIGKDGKCTEAAACPYGTIVENYILAICRQDPGVFESRVIGKEKAADIFMILNTDFMRIFFPQRILETANNCLPDVELFVNGYLINLYIYATLADQIPEAAKEKVLELLNTLEDDPETRSRMISKNPNVEQWISTLENALGLNEQQTFTDPNPIASLGTFRSGDKILSYYFDVNQPFGKVAGYDVERASQNYLNKLRGQNATASEGLPFQVDRLKSLADQLYRELGQNYGHTIELIAYADSEEGANQTLLQARVDVIQDYLINYNNGALRPFVSGSGVINIIKNTKEGIPRPPTNQSQSESYSTTACNNRRVDVIFRRRTQHQQIQRPRQGNSGAPQQGDNSTVPTDNAVNIRDRDGNSYPIKVMADGRRWMTKNLNIQVNDSWCYENKAENCAEYGRLYTWEAAKEACRLLGDGWRLPTDEEWGSLRDAYGGEQGAYKALIEGGDSKFTAQLGGWRNNIGSFHDLDSNGYYWSSTPNGGSGAWNYYFDRNYGELYRYYFNRGDGHAVRCLQDD